MDRKLWFAGFSRHDLPAFECPRCGRPSLSLDKSTLHTKETGYSNRNKKSEHWEPEFTDERFSGLLLCTNAHCGEVISMSGHVFVEPAFDAQGGWDYEGMLHPQSMSPAPRIIKFPDKLPASVVVELDAAFRLYWGDYGACAMKIRTSVERLMDHFKVPKLRVAKDQKNPAKRGKLVPVDLAVRIDKFIKASGKTVHQETLHALRVVGNVGVHKNEIERSELLDAFEIYEHALAELIGRKSAQLAQMAKKLRQTAGKRKRDIF